MLLLMELCYLVIELVVLTIFYLCYCVLNGSVFARQVSSVLRGVAVDVAALFECCVVLLMSKCIPVGWVIDRWLWFEFITGGHVIPRFFCVWFAMLLQFC
jgi:hypothetical protein